jgi:hypothetical protein
MKDEIIPITLKGLVGSVSAFLSSNISLAKLSLLEMDILLGIVAKFGGILVALATLISICFTIRRQWKSRNAKKGGDTDHLKLMTVAMAFVVIGCTSGCTAVTNGVRKLTGQAHEQKTKIEEESKALTTGTVDALEQAPRDHKAVNMARELAKADQQIEGMPLKRLPVAAALADDAKALKEMEKRLAAIPVLQAELNEMESALAQKEAALREMGIKYEQEKNTKLRTRIKRWVLGTLGIGGLIALLVFCPALIVPFGQLLAFIVGRIPRLAAATGLVAKKAFDETVQGIGKARQALKEAQDPAAKIQLDQQLSQNTSQWTKALIEQRRKVLNV